MPYIDKGKMKPSPRRAVKKDTSAFGGKPHFSERERRNWMTRHQGDVFRITKGRVKGVDVQKYGNTLAGDKKWGSHIEKNKGEHEIIRKGLKRKMMSATGREKEQLRQDLEVLDKMFGTENK